MAHEMDLGIVERLCSEIDSSSGSEIDEDRLAKCVHRQAYSDSDDSYDEIDENSSPTNSPKDHKFDWKLLEITQNVTNTVSRNFQEKGKPGLKRHHSPTRNSKSNGKTQNNNDVSGNSKALQNLKLDKEEINSENRREKFSYNDIGPTKTYANPYEAFTAIWDNKIMEHIVKETNRYARQSNINQWQDTTVDEMYIYLGLVINTTIHVADVMKEYWFPFCEYLPMSDFPFLMSYERFKELTNCIHFNDNEKQSETINSQAKLYKLQPLIDLLNENFSVLYNVGQDIVLDEGLSQWRGWIVNTRAICEEPDPVDIKSVEICEPNTGYLWRVKFVTGDVTSEIIPGLVIQLLNGLEGKGHTLWLDKFYSSPILARKLKELGFDCAGLLKKSLLPTEVLERVKNITSNEEEKDGNFSEIFGSTSDDVDVFAWITKNRCMNFITTYHEVKTEITDVKSPKIMLDYNTIMQGVHRKDNLLFEFPMERKRAHIRIAVAIPTGRVACPSTVFINKWKTD
nr:piggyBac transposable element-derived protein 4-like [Maniola hyperantus]